MIFKWLEKLSSFFSSLGLFIFIIFFKLLMCFFESCKLFKNLFICKESFLLVFFFFLNFLVIKVCCFLIFLIFLFKISNEMFKNNKDFIMFNSVYKLI